jgi:hypothetical protein
MPGIGQKLRESVKEIDGQFLLFLVLLCEVKLVVKALALLLLLWRHRFVWKAVLRCAPRLPLLYPALFLAGLTGALIAGRFSEAHYRWAFAGSEAIWLACGLLSFGMYAEARYRDQQRLEKTLEAFLLLNALVSFFQLGRIMLESGALNPYRYQGNYQKYFINTGDYIKGISFDTSTTNAVLCAIGILFFVQKGHWAVVSLCLATLVLAGSNLVNALVLAGLAFLFCFRSTRAQKSILVLCTLPFILFWSRVSPQNTGYLQAVLGWNEPAAAAAPKSAAAPQNEEERREAFARRWIDSMGTLLVQRQAAAMTVEAVARPERPTDNIHSAPFQHRDDSGAKKQQWLQEAKQLGARQPTAIHSAPGKLVAFKQTLHWLRQHPALAISGSGPATFSSKMAFKATALDIAGQYPKALAYRSYDFEQNHLALFLSFFTAPEKMHSVVHTPNSVYDQLLGEYGLIGIALISAYFFVLTRNARRLREALPLLGLLVALLATDYWMEQLSVLPLFELLFFLQLYKYVPHEPES